MDAKLISLVIACSGAPDLSLRDTELAEQPSVIDNQECMEEMVIKLKAILAPDLNDEGNIEWMSEKLLLSVDQCELILPPADEEAFCAHLVQDLVHNMNCTQPPTTLMIPHDIGAYGVNSCFWEVHKSSWKMCQHGSSQYFEPITIPFIRELNPGLVIEGKSIEHILSSPYSDRITRGIGEIIERKRDHIQQILQVLQKTLQREEPGGELIIAGGSCVFLMGLTTDFDDIDIYASKMSHATYARLIALFLMDLYVNANVSIHSIRTSSKTMDIGVMFQIDGSNITSLYKLQFILRVDDDPCRPVASFDFSGLKAYLRLKNMKFYGSPETGVNIITHRFLWARIHKYGWRGWRFYLMTHSDSDRANFRALLQSKKLRSGQFDVSNLLYTSTYFKHRSFTAQSILQGEGRFTCTMGRMLELTVAMHIKNNSKAPSKFHSFDLS